MVHLRHYYVYLSHTGKYGDGSDVTTWKINFRCALNGLKDIVERKDLEEQDCRVYQMLPQSGTSRRRKRRRPGYFSTDISGLQSPDNESETRMRLDLQSPVTTPTFSIHQPSNFSAITPVSTLPPTAVSPIQVLPIIPTGSPLRVPIMMSPTTPQGSSLGVIQKLKSIIPHTIFTTHLRTTDASSLETTPTLLHGMNEVTPVRLHGRESSVSSQPPTPRTPVSRSS